MASSVRRGGRDGRLPWSGDLAHDELLLAEAPEVAHQEVEDEAGGELQREEAEARSAARGDDRHLRVHVRRVAPALAGLQEAGDDDEPDEDEVGERVEEAAGDAGRVLREVHAQELLRVRAGPSFGHVALVGVELAVRTGAERGVEVGRLRDVLVRVAHDAEERQEDRHLHQERETTRERVDLVLLVELHHLFVELGAVVLVLRLELLDLRLRPLHGHHRLGLLGREREHHQHHEDREQDDRRPRGSG